MKKNVAIVWVWVVFFCSTSACGPSMSSSWEEAEKKNTIEAYRDFLDKNPVGSYPIQARQRIAKLSYEAAEKENTILAYKMYLAEYPVGSLSLQAEERLKQLLEKKCVETGSCEDYLELVPRGAQAEHVRIRIEKKMYEESNTVLSCMNYLDTFPDGQYVAVVQKKMERLMYEACTTIHNCKAYLRAYPTGQYSEDAKKKIETLMYEDTSTINGSKAYLAKYPGGEYAKVVNKKLNRMVYEKELSEFNIASGSCRTLETFIEDVDNLDLAIQAKTQIAGRTKSINDSMRRLWDYDGISRGAGQDDGENNVVIRLQCKIGVHDRFKGHLLDIVKSSGATHDRFKNLRSSAMWEDKIISHIKRAMTLRPGLLIGGSIAAEPDFAKKIELEDFLEFRFKGMKHSTYTAIYNEYPRFRNEFVREKLGNLVHLFYELKYGDGRVSNWVLSRENAGIRATWEWDLVPDGPDDYLRIEKGRIDDLYAKLVGHMWVGPSLRSPFTLIPTHHRGRKYFKVNYSDVLALVRIKVIKGVRPYLVIVLLEYNDNSRDDFAGMTALPMNDVFVTGRIRFPKDRWVTPFNDGAEYKDGGMEFDEKGVSLLSGTKICAE